MVYFVMWGFAAGVGGTTIVVLLLPSVYKGQEAQAMGFWNFSMSLAMVSGPPLAGKYSDFPLLKPFSSLSYRQLKLPKTQSADIYLYFILYQ